MKPPILEFLVVVGTAVKNSPSSEDTPSVLLASLIEHLPLMVFVKDAKTLQFVQFNRAGEELVGRSREELIGKNDYDFFPAEQADFFISKDREVLKGREAVEIPEEPLLTTRGLRMLHTRKIPLLDGDGSPQYLLGISEDVTDKLKAEAERVRLVSEQAAFRATIHERERALESRDEFLSIASHELKTPVTSLKLQLEMILRHTQPGSNRFPTPEKLRSVLKSSIQQIDRLTRLIEDLLDVSRIRAGKVTFSFEETCLSSWVREVVVRHFECLPSETMMPELMIEEGIYADIDRDRIEQVLLNLISNVIKYAPGKPFKIKLGRVGDDQGERIELSVTDSGPGIPRSEQARIFERFERAVPSRNISGLGLGLFIAKQIVEGHQGQMFLESEVNQGCTFTVQLPMGMLRAMGA